MKYIDSKIKTYLKDLGSDRPAPGGGSSAALAAAMAASLVSMVCHFSLGRQKYKKFESSIKKILKKSVSLQERLAELVDKDVQAYQAKNYKAAIEIPAKVCFCTQEILSLIDELLAKGNTNLFSDLAMAAALAESSFTCCFFYVRINVKTARLNMSGYKKLIDNFWRLSKRVKLLRKKVEEKVGNIIGR
ncbi:MAG: cyclodeaminase/cyclohydrolase family protein [Candidatus Omnitrophota bacterium]